MFNSFKRHRLSANRDLFTQTEIDEMKKQIESLSENFKVKIWDELSEESHQQSYFIEVSYNEPDKMFGLDIHYDFEEESINIFWSAKIEDEDFITYAPQVKRAKSLLSSLLDEKKIKYDFESSQFE